MGAGYSTIGTRTKFLGSRRALWGRGAAVVRPFSSLTTMAGMCLRALHHLQLHAAVCPVEN